jgi:hypothetical protein
MVAKPDSQWRGIRNRLVRSLLKKLMQDRWEMGIDFNQESITSHLSPSLGPLGELSIGHTQAAKAIEAISLS